MTEKEENLPAVKTEEDEKVLPAEKCCREKGVSDICFGFCLNDDNKSRAIQQTGICGKWFKIIEECNKGFDKFLYITTRIIKIQIGSTIIIKNLIFRLETNYH